MRVLVTGGAGYIGSHAVRLLRRRGHVPVVYDNLSTGHRFLAGPEGEVEFIQGDIGARSLVSEALRGVDAVMHFAAFSTVAESVRDPHKYFANNVEGGMVLLDCVLAAKTPHFIFSSSCAVYGHPSVVPIRDDAPRQPINPYGATKVEMEQALAAYHAAYGLRYLSLRYFNAAGADEAGGIGECHEPETHLIPLALQTAAGQRPHLDIYGTDYPTPDGTCIRDYIHVNDLAEAHLSGLEYLAAGGASRAFNLGTGEGYSVLRILDAVERITSRPVERRIGPRRQGDPPILVADAAQARRQLKWMPRRNLDAIVTTAWNWLQESSKKLKE